MPTSEQPVMARPPLTPAACLGGHGVDGGTRRQSACAHARHILRGGKGRPRRRQARTEEGEFLVLPDAAPIDGVEAAVAGLQAQATDRQAAEKASLAAVQSARKEQQDKENEERKRMRDGISDDAAARKEPGWQAKAAGVKGGRAITGCSDVGIGCDSGG